MAKLDTVIMRGLHADRPAAGTGGRLYYETDTSTLYRDSGSTWESIEGVGDFSNPMTTAGDIIKGGSSGTPARLAVGTAGQVLTVSGGAPTWQTPTGGFTNPMTTVGDVIVGGSSGAATRLAKGTEGQVLAVVGGAVGWLTVSGVAASGTAGQYIAHANVTPAPNASNKTFSLPEAALFGTITMYIKPSGQSWYSVMGNEDYTEDGFGTDVIPAATVPTVSPAVSSGPAVNANDNNASTYVGWNAYTNVSIAYDLGSAYEIRKGTVTANTDGGWSGPKDVLWEYSDDGSSWTTALSSTCVSDGDGVKSVFTWTSVGAHRYWRLFVSTSWVNTGGYTISVQEIEMMVATATSSSVTMTAAPATGDKLLASYQRAT